MKETGNEEIDLSGLFMACLRKWWLIALCAIALAGAGLAVSTFAITPQYESSTSIYVIADNKNNASMTYSDMQFASQMIKDYNQLLKSRQVMETVIGHCGLKDTYGEILNRVSVSSVADTRIIRITVTDPSPRKAQEIADTIREVGSVHIQDVTDAISVKTVDAANLPLKKASPSRGKWTMMGGFLGALLAIGGITIAFLLDDTIKSADDVEKYLGLSTLALIPIVEQDKKRKKNAKKSRSAKSGKGKKQ